MKPRESWGSKIGFLMATAGSAVGLGSLWKFPYVAGENGGGFFVLAYLFFTFLIGVPIFMGELLMGRAAQLSPIAAFRELSSQSKEWKVVGWTCVLASLLVLSYYMVVAGWALNYALMSLLNFTAGKSQEEISNTFNTLYTSGQINVFWHFAFVVLTTAIVYRGIRKGIEFWSKIMMPVLFAILIGLFLYSTTLSGFSEAFSFIFYPDPTKLSPSGLLQALGLACFTLSVGMGILITYGSYMHLHEDIPNTAFTIASVDILVSLLAALMIFPIIFTFDFTPQEGPGLLFKTLPVLFAKLPGTLLLSTTFFILVVFAALTSTISVMEVLVATSSEIFQWPRHKGAIFMGSLVFILGIPSALAGSGTLFKNWSALYGKNFFETIDYFSFTWLLPLNAALTSLFVGWVLDKELRKNQYMMGTRWSGLFGSWLFLLRWVVPVGVILIMLQQANIINIDRLIQKN